MRLAPELVQHAIKLLLKQRKCILDIKEKPISIYNQSYTNNYLKQRNIISFNTFCISTAP